MRTFVAVLLFCFLSTLGVTNAHSNMGLIRRVVAAHPDLPTSVRPPAARTPAIRTDSDCATTNYNSRFWAQFGGTSTKLLGNWHGSGSLKVIDKASGVVYVTDAMSSTWNVTFDDILGRIDWIDNTVTSGTSISNDIFHRYLTPGGNMFGGWYSCTNLDDASTAGAIDREVEVFPGLSTSYSVMTNKSTGEQLSDCTYHFTDSDLLNLVSCKYYDGLSSFVPPGLTIQYSLSMRKQGVAKR